MNCYPIPLELVRQLVTPTGWAFMVRAKMKGAEFERFATVTRRCNRYVAEIRFQHPVGPERQTGIVVMLAVTPDQELAAA